MSSTLSLPLRRPRSRIRHLPELIYSVLFSSLSVNLLYQRREATTERRHLNARISILEDLTRRLKEGERIEETEIERLRKLGREGQRGVDENGVAVSVDEEIGWKEVFLGKKTTRRRSDRDDISGGASTSNDLLLSFTPHNICQRLIQLLMNRRRCFISNTRHQVMTLHFCGYCSFLSALRRNYLCYPMLYNATAKSR